MGCKTVAVICIAASIALLGGCGIQEATGNAADANRLPQAQASTSVKTWAPLVSGFYMLESDNVPRIYLSASIDTNTHMTMVGMVDMRDPLCQKGTTTALEDMYFRVNQRPIYFHGVCLNGTELRSPVTNEEKSYLVNILNSESNVYVEMDTTNKLIFENGNFKAVQAFIEGR